MTKLLGDFICVLPGTIHPVTIPAGSDCPEGMEEYARQQDLLEVKKLTAAGKKAAAEAEAARAAEEEAARKAAEDHAAKAAADEARLQAEAAAAAEAARAAAEGAAS